MKHVIGALYTVAKYRINLHINKWKDKENTVFVSFLSLRQIPEKNNLKEGSFILARNSKGFSS
jgi:hypothetical protein